MPTLLARSYPARERLREGVKLPAIAPCVKYIKRHDGHRPSSFTLRSEERHSQLTPRDMTDQEDFEPKAPYLEELDSESHVRAWAAKYDGYSKTGGKQRPHDCVSEIVLLALVTCGIDTQRHCQSKEEKGLNNKVFIDAILSLHTADNLEVAKDTGCAAIDALEMDGEFGVGSSLRYLMDFGKATKAHVKGLTEVEPAYILNSFVKGIRPKAVRDTVKRGVVGPDKGWSDASAGRLLVAP